MSEAENRTDGARTKLAILEMGMRLWMVDPSFVSARRIASEMSIAHGTVHYHFPTSQCLRDAIAFHAVKQGESRVIAHLIVMRHPSTVGLTDAQRADHIKSAAAH